MYFALLVGAQCLPDNIKKGDKVKIYQKQGNKEETRKVKFFALKAGVL